MESSPREEPDPLLETKRLLTRAKAGDRDARSLLLERYRRPLERYVHARLPRAARRLEDTHDIAQEVATRALASLDRVEYRGVGSFWGYLRTIARNHLIEASRKASGPGHPGPLSDDSALAPPAAAPGPSTLASRREEMEAFERALSSVPSQHRDALLLRLELDLDYRSIAQECAFPSPDAARMAVCRALVRVGEEMSRAGFTG